MSNTTAFIYFSGLASFYLLLKYQQLKLLQLPRFLSEETITYFKKNETKYLQQNIYCSKYKEAMKDINYLKNNMDFNDPLMKNDIIIKTIFLERQNIFKEKISKDIDEFEKMYNKLCQK